MSEQQVLPEFIATLKAAAEKAEIGEWQVVRGKGGEGWTICSLGDDRDGNPVSIETMGVRGSQLRCSILNDAEFFVAASPENILKLLASLAQSEAERERLQEAYEQSTYSLGMKVIETATLRAELAREREANQWLRQVVKKYREEHEIHSGCDDEFGLCTICKQADASIEDKAKPVVTTS